MITPHDITIYNKYIENRAEKWKRSEIREVNWQAAKAVSGLQAGYLQSNSAAIFIPFSSGTQYVLPKAWQLNKIGWTLQEGDVIVKGIVPDEITDVFTITSLRAKYDDVVVITSIDAMDMGSANVRHWELGAK
jgi:hypothetical protein